MNHPSSPGFQRLIQRAKILNSQGGALKVLSQGVEKSYVYAATPLVKLLRQHRLFTYQGNSYPYFFDSYNATWRNERGVEIALAIAFLKKHQKAGTTVLELGNVMAYYGHPKHTVVDKYEPTHGILNVDILDFEPKKTFDLTLSISTIEHIGWDEHIRDPDKVLHAIQKIKNLTSQGGHSFVTFPLGHNAFLDKHLAEGRVNLPNLGFLKRTSQSNIWVEVTLKEALGAQYNHPYRAANVIAVSIS